MRCDCDWCPNIPDTWKQVRIKDIAILKSGDSFTAEELSDDGTGFPVYGGNGLRGYTDRYNKNGDYVLIGRQGALCGNINYAHGKFFATEHALVVNTFKKQNTTWLGETLRCADYNRLSQSAAQPGLAASVLMNQFIPYPPREEREHIAAYLDDKTAKIDKSVSLLQKKRDAYTRLKSSIINRAVTRGLNPNVKLKDSGVEWIGMIPENWEVRRMKDLSLLDPLCKKVNLRGNVSFVPMESLRCGDIDLKEISFEKALGKYNYFENGDLLIAKVTPCFENGNIALAEGLMQGVGFGSSEIFVLRIDQEKLNNKFMFYVSLTEAFKAKACSTMHGVGGLKRIDPLFMRTYKLSVPPKEEQQAIASYLDTHCSRIDHAISIVDKEIDGYSRLKKSLINEVVTGKRKV